MSVRSIVALASFAGALTALGLPTVASAQSTPAPIASPTPLPAPSPTASPIPKPQLLRFGYGFGSLEAEVAPGVFSEFHTTPSATTTTVSAWAPGDLIFWKLRIFGATDYRTYSYKHAQNSPFTVCPNGSEPGCVQIVGPQNGQTNVAPFTARESELEGSSGLEVGLGFYVGGALLARTNNYGYSQVKGIGWGFGRAPRPHERISPYFAFLWYPNVGGNVATPDGKLGFSYKGAHYRLGSLFEVGPSRFYLDAGLIGTRFSSRASAPSDIRDSAGYAGLAYRI